MSIMRGKAEPENKPDDLAALADKLKAARGDAEPSDQSGQMQSGQAQTSAMAVGMKYATEFSAATLVGAALGYGVDYFAGTSPWGLLAGLILGVCAGVREIIRSAREGMDANPPEGDS